MGSGASSHREDNVQNNGSVGKEIINVTEALPHQVAYGLIITAIVILALGIIAAWRCQRRWFRAFSRAADSANETLFAIRHYIESAQYGREFRRMRPSPRLYEVDPELGGTDRPPAGSSVNRGNRFSDEDREYQKQIDRMRNN